MDQPIVIMIISFVFLLLLNVPIAVSIALATLLTLLSVGTVPPDIIVAQRMSTGVENFALLAIPFFILSGLFMGQGGIARRLIDFANALIGRLTGGLSFVNILTCMFFGAISGSSVAAVSSVGGFMIPEMNRRGYGKTFNVAVTTTAATTGLLIPPSNVMIVYSLACGGTASIAALFMAGVVPGIIVGVSLMLIAGIISHLRHYGYTEKLAWEVMLKGVVKAIPSLLLMALITGALVFLFMKVKVEKIPVGMFLSVAIGLILAWVAERVDRNNKAQAGDGAVVRKSLFLSYLLALPSLLLVIVVIGGILLGMFTPTEAAAIAVLYAFIMAVFFYREVKLSEIPGMLLSCGATTAMVMLLIGASSAMSWILAYENIPQSVSAALIGLSDNPIVILLIINALLLFVGTFMDMTPAILIFTPIFLPVAKSLGLNPVHFGIIMITNLCIGLCTPPVGTCLFVGC
ncbi:MAG: TRAP transporter large permease, partial [Sedimentisphaerales bacterium]|nr:TRAP transporter large permease [Sedimentisphaerales bacterium]